MSSNNNVKLLKKSISNIDIFVLANELNSILEDGFIQNVYEIPSKEGKNVLLKCRTKSGKKNIIIDPKKRINFTDFSYPVPPFPSQFTMSLRKFMKGRRIERIYQYNLDRILIFQLKSSEGNSWKFIIEFFGGGNYILVNGDNLTIIAKSYRKMRERMILAKKPYDFPISGEIDLLNLNEKDFFEKIQKSEGELVRILARSLNIGGYIAEEICHRSSIDKKKKTSELSEKELKILINSLKSITDILINKNYAPVIILDKKNNPIGFEPFHLNIYEEYQTIKKESFNQTIDDFFSKFDSDDLFKGDVIESKQKLTKNEKILKKQLEKIDESIEIRKKSLEQGHLIYQYLNQIDALINTIMLQKRENKRDWKEISNILIKGKEKQIPECLIFDRIFQKEVKIQINLEGYLFKLDLKKNAIENANYIYQKAKKATKKRIGAEKAAENTKKKLEIQLEKHEEVEARKAILVKRPKQKWYEKYRWYISTDNFLIVGGRDASSNEVIVKKHMNNNDYFFHTDVRGASVCIIKNDENQEIPAQTIKETAQFASCYSSAWKQGWGNAEIYYVYPEQVSKSPKSGEYLKKGSFVINGKKNYLTKPYLEIALGIKLIPVNVDNEDNQESEKSQEYEDSIEKVTINEKKEMEDDFKEEIQYYPMVLSAPASAIIKQTRNFVRLKPSKSGVKSSQLAKKILKNFISNSSEEEKKWVRLTSLDDIIRIIPSGMADIAKK